MLPTPPQQATLCARSRAGLRGGCHVGVGRFGVADDIRLRRLAMFMPGTAAGGVVGPVPRARGVAAGNGTTAWGLMLLRACVAIAQWSSSRRRPVSCWYAYGRGPHVLAHLPGPMGHQRLVGGALARDAGASHGKVPRPRVRCAYGWDAAQTRLLELWCPVSALLLEVSSGVWVG